VPLYLIRDTVDYFGSSGNDIYGSVDLYDLAYIVEQNPDLDSAGLRNASNSVMNSVNTCVIANRTEPRKTGLKLGM